jgi:hypothetical protein
MKAFIAAVLIISAFFTNNLMAQDTEDVNPSKFSPGVDFYSSYIWRGSLSLIGQRSERIFLSKSNE